MDSFNREFVRLMAESGWTSSDCVARLGLSKGAISQYRNGITRPSLQVLRLYSALTGIPLQIVGEKPPPTRPQIQMTEQEEGILALIRRFDPAQRSALAGMLTAMSAERLDSPPVPRQSTDPAVVATAAQIVADAAAAVERRTSRPKRGAAKRRSVERHPGDATDRGNSD